VRTLLEIDWKAYYREYLAVRREAEYPYHRRLDLAVAHSVNSCWSFFSKDVIMGVNTGSLFIQDVSNPEDFPSLACHVWTQLSSRRFPMHTHVL
jgi:hypothetical protein